MEKHQHMLAIQCALPPKETRRHWHIRVLVFICLCLSLASGAYAAEAPQNFFAKQYSSSAGELFWDRPDRPVRGFELTRNNVDLGIFDARSYYDDTLEPGILYTYTIAAVELDDTRSDIATTELDQRAAIPVAPTVFRAEVYSRTAAELFWNRSGDRRIRFEVTIEDGVPAKVSGGSLFLNALEPGTTYRASIRAINPSTGAATASRQITFTTEGIPIAELPEVAPPPNLRVEIYSTTSAEFFWDRASESVLRYEISLNGELINNGALVDGTSVYLDTLEAGSTNTISVVAVNRRKIKSEPAELSFEMSPGDDDVGTPPLQPEGSPISVENVDNVLSKVFDIIEDYGHLQVSDALGNFRFTEPARPLPGLTLISDESFVVSGMRIYRRIYACAEGGNFIHEPLLNAFGDATLIFENCALPGLLRNGTVVIANVDGISTTYRYDNYIEEQFGIAGVDSKTIELTGEAGSGGARVGNFFSEFAVLDFGLTTSDSHQRVSNLQQRFTFDSNTSSPNTFTTDFEVSANWTRDRTLQIETIDPFQTTDINSVSYELGLFRITDMTTPENYIDFNADTGDIETYQLTIVVDDTITTDVRRWDELS